MKMYIFGSLCIQSTSGVGLVRVCDGLMICDRSSVERKIDKMKDMILKTIKADEKGRLMICDL